MDREWRQGCTAAKGHIPSASPLELARSLPVGGIEFLARDRDSIVEVAGDSRSLRAGELTQAVQFLEGQMGDAELKQFLRDCPTQAHVVVGANTRQGIECVADGGVSTRRR